jgi:hypothetical protein
MREEFIAVEQRAEVEVVFSVAESNERQGLVRVHIMRRAQPSLRTFRPHYRQCSHTLSTTHSFPFPSYKFDHRRHHPSHTHSKTPNRLPTGTFAPFHANLSSAFSNSSFHSSTSLSFALPTSIIVRSTALCHNQPVIATSSSNYGYSPHFSLQPIRQDAGWRHNHIHNQNSRVGFERWYDVAQDFCTLGVGPVV